jgi:hypothetical protein
MNPWVKVEKERLQKKFIIQNDSFVESLSDSSQYDCAMEVTELKVNNNLWWSMGFDLLTKDKDVQHLEQFIELQLGHQFQVKLKSENSCGYPEWISRISKNL